MDVTGKVGSLGDKPLIPMPSSTAKTATVTISIPFMTNHGINRKFSCCNQ